MFDWRFIIYTILEILFINVGVYVADHYHNETLGVLISGIAVVLAYYEGRTEDRSKK